VWYLNVSVLLEEWVDYVRLVDMRKVIGRTWGNDKGLNYLKVFGSVVLRGCF